MSTKNLKIGSKIPNFRLTNIDGNILSLDDFKDKRILIVIFSCNHCPYVQAYEDRIIDIQKKYGDKGVQIIAINSNGDIKYPEDSFENMQKRANEKEFNFPYLRDEEQSVAKSFDATHTPEIFLFDSERKLAYHGKIDDNWKEPGRVKSQYLQEALGELLEGKEVSVPETFSIGCTIKWKQFS